MKKINIIITLILLTLLTSCADFFQRRVPMDFDSTNATLEDLLVEKTTGGKLGTPTQLLVSKNKYSSSISLKWSTVPDAVSYRIEYAIIGHDSEGNYPKYIPEEQFNVLENFWYSTEYLHEIPNTIDDYKNRYEKRFYYRVIATNIRDGYDDGDPTPSNIYGTLLAPPKNVKASTGDSTEYIEVKWDFVSGANRYEIYRSNNENGAGAGFIKAVEGNLNKFRDQGIGPKDKGKEFYYIVYALNGSCRSEQSSIAMGYSLVPGAPGAPKNVKITSGRGDSPDKIVIKWDKVQNEDPIVYNVFRSSSKDSALTKVGRELKVTEFADNKQLEPNIYYNYVVQAVSLPVGQDPKTSPMSNFAEGYILSCPQNIKAKKYDNKVKLSWEKPIGLPDEQSNYSYKIYGCNELDGVYTEIGTATNIDNEAFVDKYAFYKIKTINGSVESKESEAIAPAPDAVTTVNVSRADYSFVKELGLNANEGGVYPAKITWEKPANDNPSGYFVYRSLKEDSGYRKVSNEVIQGYEYLDIDETLQPGKVYYYKVLSLNALEQGENFSDCQYGWGALTHKQYLKQFNETVVSSQKKLTLMHKPGSTDKLGSETKKGNFSGNVYYNAAVQGLGAYIVMKYTDYVDFYINPMEPSMGVKFKLNGNSDTSANMSSNGTMNGTITCEGMYPGSVNYNNIEIKAGAAGGGSYGVTPEGFTTENVDFSVLEEK